MFKKVTITFNPANRKFIRKKFGFWFKFYMLMKYNLVIVLIEDFYASKRTCKIKMRHQWVQIGKIIKRRANFLTDKDDSDNEDDLNQTDNRTPLPKTFPLTSLEEEPTENGEVAQIHYKNVKKSETEFIDANEIDIEIEDSDDEEPKLFNLDDIGIDTNSSPETLKNFDNDFSDVSENSVGFPNLELDIMPKYKKSRNSSTAQI